ncbi:MAG: hypothetical protein QGD94_01620, partial [Planctomycetia bacterium]|nr:hypothetical protein [Planctomycetia bacterium]
RLSLRVEDRLEEDSHPAASEEESAVGWESHRAKSLLIFCQITTPVGSAAVPSRSRLRLKLSISASRCDCG